MKTPLVRSLAQTLLQRLHRRLPTPRGYILIPRRSCRSSPSRTEKRLWSQFVAVVVVCGLKSPMVWLGLRNISSGSGGGGSCVSFFKPFRPLSPLLPFLPRSPTPTTSCGRSSLVALTCSFVRASFPLPSPLVPAVQTAEPD